MAAMSMGSMARGNRRMLKREMEVKAFSAVNTFSEFTPTNTANVARETYKKRQCDKKRFAKNFLDLVFLRGSFTGLTRAGAQLKIKVETDVR